MSVLKMPIPPRSTQIYGLFDRFWQKYFFFSFCRGTSTFSIFVVGFNTLVILIITRFLLVEVTVKNDFLKGILGTFKERIKTEISSEVIAYVEQ